MSKYSQPAALVITGDEVEQLTAPFVVEVAGKAYALKSPNSVTLDDFGEIVDVAEEDLSKLPPLLAHDKPSETFLRTCGIGVMRLIFERWIESQHVTLGESSSSEA